MDRAISLARRFGVGVCLALHTSHWGRAHHYAARAAGQGMAGICTTNGMPCMAVWGAKGRVIGNNPLAIAIPRSEDGAPVVLDMAMSRAAVGRVGTSFVRASGRLFIVSNPSFAVRADFSLF
jgi:LDH2 family malate/lactate/ureidoglycolate dehydrogenase